MDVSAGDALVGVEVQGSITERDGSGKPEDRAAIGESGTVHAQCGAATDVGRRTQGAYAAVEVQCGANRQVVEARIRSTAGNRQRTAYHVQGAVVIETIAGVQAHQAGGVFVQRAACCVGERA